MLFLSNAISILGLAQVNHNNVRKALSVCQLVCYTHTITHMQMHTEIPFCTSSFQVLFLIVTQFLFLEAKPFACRLLQTNFSYKIYVYIWIKKYVKTCIMWTTEHKGRSINSVERKHLSLFSTFFLLLIKRNISKAECVVNVIWVFHLSSLLAASYVASKAGKHSKVQAAQNAVSTHEK